MTDDELDPLAPVFYDDGSPEEEPDESDGGFSDVDRVVRVWVADGRLTKVRVSPVWYRKLRNTTMESAFGQAFWQSNLTIAPVPDEDTAPAATMHATVVADMDDPSYHGNAVCGQTTDGAFVHTLCVMGAESNVLELGSASDTFTVEEMAALAQELYEAL
ncbi:hypothetical protein GCM10028820_21430 [Tessaracoccus terricola]